MTGYNAQTSKCYFIYKIENGETHYLDDEEDFSSCITDASLLSFREASLRCTGSNRVGSCEVIIVKS